MTCGSTWLTGEWDGAFGVGQQMNALEVIQSNLIDTVQGPLGNGSGGTSIGDPGAGLGGNYDSSLYLDDITTADRAGAGILTVLVVAAMVGGGYWIVT